MKDIALVINILRPIYVFFGALVARPLSTFSGTEILIGKVIKKITHQITINNKKFVKRYI